MVKKIVISCGIALVALAASANPGDSIKVVKGQISDYYIAVTRTRTVTGIVRDAAGKPLEGATVMFFASPMHCNTDASGRYSIVGRTGDKRLYVYYPGKKIVDMPVEFDQTNVDITMVDGQPMKVLPRNAARATKWYNPKTYAPRTFCNPMNTSYNYEPYNDNVRPEGSLRSSADPMGLTYKGEYFLFSTNQGGFHY